MKDLYFMRCGYIKSLAILCTVLLLSACDGLDGATPSSAGGDLGTELGTPVLGAPGSVTLSWTPPTLRADNVTPLAMAEIAGYRIYYGTTSGIYPNSVDIPDRTVQQLTVENIPAGRYFFVMTTLDLEGRESKFSSPVIQRQV